MASFATIEDLENFLQLEISTATQIAAATQALERTTAAIKNYCRQEIELVEGDVVVLGFTPGQRLVFLPELPVVEVSSVVEDENVLVVDDDYKLANGGLLHRIGAFWYSGIGTVTVTYTHGYATIPEDIVDVCTRAAARVYQAGLKAVEVGGVSGVASKSLGDFSVSFGPEVGEGVMGASAARPLLLSEKELLNRYRIKGP